MNGHTDAVPRATPIRWCSSELGSGVSVVHPHTALGFMPMTHADWPLANYLELGAFPTAVGCARRRTHVLLKEWGLADPDLPATSELLISELATNAVATTVRHQLGTPIRFRLAATRRVVLIEVWDADPTPPPAPANEPPLPDTTSGRGLFLVSVLGARWSWYAVPRGPGKVIWVEVAR
jgi:anti-sigma regulatory factor (Ser/Thr protein kinase)